jgi:hypothetical protein
MFYYKVEARTSVWSDGTRGQLSEPVSATTNEKTFADFNLFSEAGIAKFPPLFRLRHFQLM